MKSTKTLWFYVTSVFVLSYLWQFVMFLTGSIESILFPFMMLIPAIVAIVFRILNKEGFRQVGWGLRRWWYVIPALITPIIIALVVGYLLTTLNLATLSDNHFLFKDGMVEIQKIPLVLGNQTQSLPFFALNFALSLFVQSLLGSAVTIGEEFGWRCYLQGKMIKRFGLNRGLIFLGLIWGYWHLPIGLMGWNFPDQPILGAFILTPISTIFMGIFLAWLYLRSRSIWMPTLAHAALNLTGSLLFSELIMKQDTIILQLMFITAWGVVAAFCLFTLNSVSPVLGQATETTAVKPPYKRPLSTRSSA